MAGTGFQTTSSFYSDIEIGAVEIKDWQTDTRVGVDSDHRMLVDKQAPFAIRVDDSTLNIIYLGRAVVGSLDSAAVWSIKKIDSTTGVVMTWASGDYNFNKIWNNRLTYTYL